MDRTNDIILLRGPLDGQSADGVPEGREFLASTPEGGVDEYVAYYRRTPFLSQNGRRVYAFDHFGPASPNERWVSSQHPSHA